jgi:hypothetical protein
MHVLIGRKKRKTTKRGGAASGLVSFAFFRFFRPIKSFSQSVAACRLRGSTASRVSLTVLAVFDRGWARMDRIPDRSILLILPFPFMGRPEFMGTTTVQSAGRVRWEMPHEFEADHESPL